MSYRSVLQQTQHWHKTTTTYLCLWKTIQRFSSKPASEISPTPNFGVISFPKEQSYYASNTTITSLFFFGIPMKDFISVQLGKYQPHSIRVVPLPKKKSYYAIDTMKAAEWWPKQATSCPLLIYDDYLHEMAQNWKDYSSLPIRPNCSAGSWFGTNYHLQQKVPQ